MILERHRCLKIFERSDGKEELILDKSEYECCQILAPYENLASRIRKINGKIANLMQLRYLTTDVIDTSSWDLGNKEISYNSERSKCENVVQIGRYGLKVLF